ncbi:MAG: error-prone DNA polymerase [Rhodoferax sp.]|nr:error-prone DNA polymerase [Rhodoferax sp.]
MSKHRPNADAATLPDYAELHCLSAFSFQRGASQPEELVQRAHRLGYAALAITDECSVAGVVRAHGEARRLGLPLLPGAEFAVPCAKGSFTVVVLPHNLQGWGNLCEFITRARRAAHKGDYRVAWVGQTGASRWHALRHCEVLLHLPAAILAESAYAIAKDAKGMFGEHCWLASVANASAQQALERLRWQQLGEVTGLALVATGQVRMHTRSRKPLHDVLTAVRCGTPVAQCGFALQANAELHLRSRARLAALFTPNELAHTLVVAGRCRFTLDALRYQYPMEAVLPGHTPAQTLRHYTEAGALERYPPITHPHGMPASVRAQVEHELALIADLQYEMYFLTVHDLVRFARGRGILCQGRGSAANSAVCYCLGVTEVDPSRMSVLFERFISKERDEPPDIDVDFEHQRREEVIQYIYVKYGRERAAITAVVASYRPRSALRDVGRALEIPEVLITAMAKEHPGMYSRAVLVERLQAAVEKVACGAYFMGAGGAFYAHSSEGGVGGGSQSGRAPSSVSPARVAGSPLTCAERPAALAPLGGVAERSGSFGAGSQASAPYGLLVDGSPLPPLRRLQLWLDLATQLQSFPRHLSQHVGGFVLTQGPLTRLVPVENASMPDRSVIQWDKDDLDAVGLLKVDVLALGMLSAIRRCLHLIGQWRGAPMRMQDVPAEDPATYAMICQADTVGVFQIESRAQMSMLPRLKPQCFYDLVVEVAIVRPGPIQGGMVHPYLKARENPAAVAYQFPALENALKRTHGVPIFQEQVMQIAMAAADFTAGEADQLRRSMAAWKRKGGVGKFYERLVGGMLKNGYTQEFADTLFKQIEGFGEYGFPESHAASFALLVYVSCWLKRHEPACFLAAMLNSQPLGFYGPAQLVQDARRHGVEVLAVDVQHSGWDCTLEQPQVQYPTANEWALQTQPAIRLGLRMVSGLQQAVAERMTGERAKGSFTSTQDLALRCALDAGDLKALASADALISLSGHRRQQVWDASALRPAPALLQGVPIEEDELALPAAEEGEEVTFDYAAMGLTLRSHPVQLLRGKLATMRLLTAAQIRDYPSGRLVRVCGIVTARQQPGTAKGVVFVTLEDETGSVNIIVWKAVKEQFRQAVYRARLMAVYGVWQRDEATGGQVRHVIAKRVVDMTSLLGDLATSSRDFH